MMKTVNGGQANPAFISDNGEKDYHINNERSPYVLELTEKGRVEKDREYDPYKERKVEHPTTNSETFFHLLKGSLGTGILAMPNAFRNAGYVTGFIGTIVIGIICTYCIHMLVKAEYELCKRKKVPSMSYPKLAEAGFSEGPRWLKACAPYIGHVVNTFLLVYQLGTCCVYVVFIASNIREVVTPYLGDTDVRLYMCIILLPLILINWVRNLKYLAPFSTFANLVTMVSFSIICYYLFRDPITFEGKEPFGTVTDFPLFFGTVLFALEAIGVILPLENEMKTPKAFGGTIGVLNISMAFIVFLYVGMGFFGYLNYGEDVKASLTFNLPADDVLAHCVQGMLAFAIYITHGLACYVAIDIAWTDYLVKRIGTTNKKIYWEYFVRTMLVLITFLLAVAVNHLDLFISLFGALCLSALGLAFPAIIQISTYWHQSHGMKKVLLIFTNTIIIIIGILGLVVGTYKSLADIIATFSGEE